MKKLWRKSEIAYMLEVLTLQGSNRVAAAALQGLLILIRVRKAPSNRYTLMKTNEGRRVGQIDGERERGRERETWEKRG